MTIRDALRLAREGKHVIFVVRSRSMANVLSKLLGALDMPGGGWVEPVSVEDMPKPGLPVSNMVVDDDAVWPIN